MVSSQLAAQPVTADSMYHQLYLPGSCCQNASCFRCITCHGFHSTREIPDFTTNANALYINIGTLSADRVPSMKIAANLIS